MITAGHVARYPADAGPISRYVVVARAGTTPVSDDVWVVDVDAPERRLMKRIFPAVSKNGAWRKALAGAVPFLAEPTAGIAPLLEIGVDAEDRLCLVFAEKRAVPRGLSTPRQINEAARLAIEAAAIVEACTEVFGAARAPVAVADVEIDLDGDVFIRNAGVPAATTSAERASSTAAAETARALVEEWGFRLSPRLEEPRVVYDYLARNAAPDLPWRTRSPGIGDARRALDALGDSDVPELERVRSALFLARASGLEEEVVRLLVRALNEPLAWLPRVAIEILSEWPIPFGLRVDDNGLLRRCAHAWAATEVVTELGGAAIERHCPDCDARVVLPQSAGVLASRCEVARAFVDVEQRDPVDVIEPGRRYPLWRGQALLLGGAVEIVNIGLGRLCMRRRTLPGENEVEPFLPGARVRVGEMIYRSAADGIVVEQALR